MGHQKSQGLRRVGLFAERAICDIVAKKLQPWLISYRV